MTERPWGGTEKVWEKLWDWHVHRCHKDKLDPNDATEISRSLDILPDGLAKLGVECDEVEQAAGLAFMEASAGLRKDHRPRFEVWWDKAYKRGDKVHGCFRFRPPPFPDVFQEEPPMHQMRTTTMAREAHRYIAT